MNEEMKEGLLAETGEMEEAETTTDVDEAAVEELIQQAKALLYGEHFERMMKVFETNGQQMFPNAMATVVVGILDRLEADNGTQTNATLLMVAIGIIAMISTDLVNGKMMQLSADDVQLAVQATVGAWLRQHKDRADIEGMQQEVAEGAMQGEGADILRTAWGGQAPQEQMPPEQMQGGM